MIVYFVSYPTISLDEARTALQELRRSNPLETIDPRIRGRGPEYDRDRVQDLRDELEDLIQGLGQSMRDRTFWARFEGAAAKLTHDVLQLPASVAADPGFWAWIVWGRGDRFFADLIDRRFQSRNGDHTPDPSNYSTTPDLEKGFLSRLWLRADIGYAPNREDPYELVLRGDQDLWRSHIMRQEYGHIRQVAQALIRFQYPDEHPERRAVSHAVIREMAKELRRRHATLAFELLSDQQADELIRSVHDAVLSSASPTPS